MSFSQKRCPNLVLDADGRHAAANRDLWRIDGYARSPGSQQLAAVVRRYLGRDDATGEHRRPAGQ